MEIEDVQRANILADRLKRSFEYRETIAALREIDLKRLSITICDSGNTRNSIRLEAVESQDSVEEILRVLFCRAVDQFESDKKELREFKPR